MMKKPTMPTTISKMIIIIATHVTLLNLTGAAGASVGWNLVVIVGLKDDWLVVIFGVVIGRVMGVHVRVCL